MLNVITMAGVTVTNDYGYEKNTVSQLSIHLCCLVMKIQIMVNQCSHRPPLISDL